jgi:Protein of unknown function (DUF2914)
MGFPKTVYDLPLTTHGFRAMRPALFFVAGVTWDTLTLSRIDRLSDNLILLAYLGALGGLIVLQARVDRQAAFPALGRMRPYYGPAIQFLFGGLFSAYAVFYSQSASFTTTAVYFGLLVGLLVANEFLRDRLSNLTMLISLYAVVLFSFLTFFLPVVIRLMNTLVFLLGVALTAWLLWRVVSWVQAPGEPERRRRREAAPGFVILGMLAAAYFFNWIPPVPLSLKFGGIFHEVSRSNDHFALVADAPPWYRWWQRWDPDFRGEGPAYCFTAVFAPTDLRVTVYHHWQFRPVGAGGRPFMTTDRIPLAIAGGREHGYRGYTAKQRVEPGEWRVDVETEDGRIIGRVSFAVRPVPEGEADRQTVVF